MWERAAEFGALLVWSEHRYYGASLPFGTAEASLDHLGFLTVEQALADHAASAAAMRSRYGVRDAAATIGFGGSYGGMRMTRPEALDDAIAASAPILSFEGETPSVDPTFFARGKSYDVSVAAGVRVRGARSPRGDGARPRCAFGRAAAVRWVAARRPGRGLYDALSYMAMGNYPYPSAYILNGDGTLPAFPVRLACGAFDALPAQIKINETVRPLI
jgi:lysosomal Pro-X carboxypeptidase